MIRATVFNDPGCPWGYSAVPALTALSWRYGDRIEWRLVMIGLAETPQRYLDSGYTPLRMALGHAVFRDRFGMPFAPVPKPRVAATSPACRAVVAARLARPGSEWAVLRALQFENFAGSLVLDDLDAVAAVAGIAVGDLDSPAVREAYEADRSESRTAAGGAGELQGKTATTDGPVRYTAPSVLFEAGRERLEATGWQSLDAYDVCVANLAPSIDRRAAPDGPRDALEAFPAGLTTQEVAQLMTRGNDAVDRDAAERALLELVAAGEAHRAPLGDDALWTAA